VPNDPNWLTIKTQAIDHIARIRLSQTDSITYIDNKSFSSNNARKSGSTQTFKPKDLNKESLDIPNTSRKGAQSTQRTFSGSIRNNISQLSRSDVTRRKSTAKASQSQFVTANASTPFSQKVKFDNAYRNSNKKNGQDYLVNFAAFMSKFIRVSNGFFYLTCGVDVLILPFILSLLLYSYYWQAAGISFLLSFLDAISNVV